MGLQETEERQHGKVPTPFVVPTEEDLFHTIIESKSRTRRSLLDQDNTSPSRHLYERSTFASRMQATCSTQQDSLTTLPLNDTAETKAAEHVHGEAPIRCRASETVSEFLSKKREIFLVQMNLDTKRAEICRLEQRALQRENALKRSEDMLEEDAIKFDAFLKENDEKVQQALKNAEAEAKKKQDKISEIKKLQVEMTAARSEVNKFEEQLEDFQKYKRFLDDVTPSEWFEEQERKRQQLKEESLEQWRRQCDAVKKRKTEAAATKTYAEQEYNNARTQQEAEAATQKLEEATENLKATKLMKEPPKPCMDAVGEEDREETYFKEPQQLLELFSGLEEQNLFLIQHLQELEEGLEKKRNRLSELQMKTDNEINNLQTQIKDLQSILKTKRRQERTNYASQGVAAFTLCDAESEVPVSFEDLQKQLVMVYEMCGFVGDGNIGMLTMLTTVEMKLEELLLAAKGIPKEYVDASERGREKTRRQRYRAEKQEQQNREHDARVKRAQERAEAPVFKKTGKPDMFRSILPKKKRDVRHEVICEDDNELAEFLARDFC